MRNIYTIGETVLDIVFKDNLPVTAKAGGSMLNTAVSLGRLGLPVHFVSEYGTDTVGHIIDNFLNTNGVETSHVYRYSEGKSALALAFLDDKNNASYSFYKAYPPERLKAGFPDVKEGDIIMFGSFYGITYEIRESLFEFLVMARNRNAVIVYDPNFRKSHLFELDRLKPAIIENMSLASIVRTSDEDMELIFGTQNADEAYEKVRHLCPNFLYTSSSKAVYLRTPYFREQFPVNKIDPVSTIGAGDTFNAGLVYSLMLLQVANPQINSLSLAQWKTMISNGVAFASEVCMSYENYISDEFAASYKVSMK
jgi:fructokinase